MRNSKMARFSWFGLFSVVTFLACKTDVTDAGKPGNPASTSDAMALYDGPCEDGKGSGTSIVYTNTWGPTIQGKTQSSVGFQFDCDGKPCACGQFADQHSFWVAPPSGASGVVHIDGFSPSRCPDCIEATGSGDSLRNGWLANPTGDISVYRGMDGRLGAADQPSPLVPTATQPYSIDTTTPGFVARMIVKANSNLETGSDCRTPDEGAATLRMCYEYFNTIAVLGAVPPDQGATILRPAIYGGDDTQKELLSTTQLDMSILPSMNIELRPSTGEPVGQGWDQSLEALLEPKMEWFYDWPGTEDGMAARNSSTSGTVVVTGYGPTRHKPVNEALLWLTMDPAQQGGSADKKRLLAIRAAEQGMDICSVVLHGGSAGDSPGEYGVFPANGGHSVGRYARTIVAATMLHHKACLAALAKTADNHLKSFCVGGTDDGQRCGDHWGLATCGGGGACVASTNPADICDEHLATFAETGQQQHANTHGAKGAGIALYGVWNSLVHAYTPDGNNPIYADVYGWIDGGSSDENGCPAQYQDIAWPAFQGELPVLKAIPATWPYVNPTYFEYMDRMFRVGTHCAPDNRAVKPGGDQSANTAQVVQLCAGGTDAGRPCLLDSQCDGGSCTANGPLHTRPGYNYVDSTYTSLQSLYQYQADKDCYANCSCPGMSGLCH